MDICIYPHWIWNFAENRSKRPKTEGIPATKSGIRRKWGLIFRKSGGNTRSNSQI